MKPLSQRHEKFCQLYVASGNATRAYEDAGYSTKGNASEVQGSKLLRNPKVAQRINEIQAGAVSKIEFSRDKTIETLIKIVESKKTKEVPTRDKLKAIDTLCKILGYYKPVEVNVNVEAKLIAMIADVTGAKQ
jgi:phage terminase small subunit